MERAETPKEEDGLGSIHLYIHSNRSLHIFYPKLFSFIQEFQIIELGKFVLVTINISMEPFQLCKITQQKPSFSLLLLLLFCPVRPTARGGQRYTNNQFKYQKFIKNIHK